MRSVEYKGPLLMTIILVMALASCRKDHWDDPPEIRLGVSPASGLTTDTFLLDASQTSHPDPNTKLYFQWDFATDGGWSTLPSKDPRQKYRFFKPGTYRLRLKVISARGGIDSTEVTIPVEQGYSKPRPHFEMSHDTAHIFTDVQFDAGFTTDDEDSLSNLRFRWDFNSDNLFDTPELNSCLTSHRFSETGRYMVTLKVTDPSGLVGYAKRLIVVNLHDPGLVADFSWSPEEGTVADTFLFDASASHHPDFPGMLLTYRWQIEEGEGWTEELAIPWISHRFRTVRKQYVRLRVTDQRGLYNDCIKAIHLDPANKPPVAGFILSIPYGNTSSLFYLSGWKCSDAEDLPSLLEVRWDFEGDGIWDTGFNTEKIIYHRYPDPGDFNTTIEVRDTRGLTATYSETVHVSRFLNETGMMMDTRDGQIYGTVKVGSQWWFAENLKYRIPSKLEDSEQPGIWEPWKVWLDFEEQEKWGEPFGRFYHIAGAMKNKEQGSPEDPDLEYTLCPRGWRVPTRNDIIELRDYLGIEHMAEKLEIGGETDFNLQYLGYVDWNILWVSLGVPLDTVYTFKDTYQDAYLYSYEQNEGEFRVDTWSLRLTRNTHDYWEGWASTRFFVPLRCIKD